MSLLVKFPLANKTLKNIGFSTVSRGPCRQNIFNLRAVYIDTVLILSWFYFVFILFLFFETHVYSYDRTGKLDAGIGGEEET